MDKLNLLVYPSGCYDKPLIFDEDYSKDLQESIEYKLKTLLYENEVVTSAQVTEAVEFVLQDRFKLHGHKLAGIL